MFSTHATKIDWIDGAKCRRPIYTTDQKKIL